MNVNRRGFLGAGLMMAVGGVADTARTEALSERQKTIRGKTYVAACPPVKSSIPRTSGPQRVMVIGAHPDDADIVCGCTAAKLVAKGVRVKFVAVCNGDIGHHRLGRKETAATGTNAAEPARLVA